MSGQSYKGETVAQIEVHVASPEFRQVVGDAGVTMAEAAERIHAAAQNFDLAEFEALIAAHRPKVWKQINKRPGRTRGLVQRLARRRG